MPEQAEPSARQEQSTRLEASASPDLSAQLVALTEVTRRQGELLERLCERVTPPQSTVPEQIVSPLTAPAAAPATVVLLPVTVPSVPVAPVGEASQMTEAEQERMAERLARFHRFDPPTFDGRCTEAWVVEDWVSSMEKLFEDLFIPEREQVHLGVHCLTGDALAWWRRVRRDYKLVTLQMTWDEFCGMLYGMYFPNSVKQKLEEDLKKIQQGGQTVQEYIREFTRLLNCVPFVARDEAHRVYLFEQGLRSEIFWLVQAQRLRTLDASMEQALWVERGDISIR
ncbi:uncharacterized protein LOC109725889 [Ananas comosus]|uniref:Uncharacterized protein LOC109725889 n=1 Tax=Ananas comosus TaxID=4615 RepID=A0A6P5GQF0_ANACO|nr:uncharacterized protein LOC109725889 [Ananas comosus]